MVCRNYKLNHLGTLEPGICAPVVLVAVVYRCDLSALWLGWGGCSVQWPHMGPLHQPLMAEQYEAFVEEHVMGENQGDWEKT